MLTVVYSQDQISEKNNNSITKTDPKMNQVQLKLDYYMDMQKIEKDKKENTADRLSRDLKAVTKIVKSDSKIKYQSSSDVIPKQILKKDNSGTFGQEKVQYRSQKKIKNSLRRVEGYAPREEVVKIDGHPLYDPEIIYQAMGHTKLIEASSQKNNQEKGSRSH
jgi:site-specific recombinase XerD